MKRTSIFALALLFMLALLFILALLPLNAAPQFDRDRDRGQEDRVCIFRDIRYEGVERCFRVGDSIRSLEPLNGQASSIRIYGRATVTVWDEANFRGHMTVFSSSIPDLGQVRVESKTWNDRIQSLQVGSSGGFAGRPRDRIDEGICVYDHPNFEGRSQCWMGGEDLSDLGRAGDWSDRIYSIRLFGRATAVVFRDIGFRGASIVVNRDIPDLSRLPGTGFHDWARQISSIRIEGRGGYDRDRRR